MEELSAEIHGAAHVLGVGGQSDLFTSRLSLAPHRTPQLLLPSPGVDAAPYFSTETLFALPRPLKVLLKHSKYLITSKAEVLASQKRNITQKCTLDPSGVPVTERSLPGMGRSRDKMGIWGGQVFHNRYICTGHAGGCQPRRSLKQPILTSTFLPYADKLTEEEFIEGTLANKEILRLIQYEPQKVKERLKEKEKNA